MEVHMHIRFKLLKALPIVLVLSIMPSYPMAWLNRQKDRIYRSIPESVKNIQVPEALKNRAPQFSTATKFGLGAAALAGLGYAGYRWYTKRPTVTPKTTDLGKALKEVADREVADSMPKPNAKKSVLGQYIEAQAKKAREQKPEPKASADSEVKRCGPKTAKAMEEYAKAVSATPEQLEKFDAVLAEVQKPVLVAKKSVQSTQITIEYDENGDTPLHRAVRNRDTKEIDRLVNSLRFHEKQKFINKVCNKNGQTVLQLASHLTHEKGNYLDIVIYLTNKLIN